MAGGCADAGGVAAAPGAGGGAVHAQHGLHGDDAARAAMPAGAKHQPPAVRHNRFELRV